ncbi:mandelate racemase/muconate lactonizing enzyme family protein [Jiella sp. MQZ13P-4]|uniref:Mandelate racemase/muconate lactonizing enzyme family protein n=1 Tax=Jiella sonneratiae TaxID=2816856 RepID=A0ABS3J250_9HYPH|nr:mandelate racemase/muconate lactonizing enzyme family protein [Jiella sonneratiae]MBO0903750.1 mandelate racemase/muconate lactonizing enzyme family protein [Jiella sonneratiae]
MRIAAVEAFALSYPLPEAAQVTLGVGRTIKRDAVVVRVRTEDGIEGFGEAHHGRAHIAVASIVNDNLAAMLKGADACDTMGLWRRMARAQMLTQGSGAAAALAMSGIDCALWDIRAKAAGWPLCRLLGGAPRPVAAYAGGVALGWETPDRLVEEARGLVARGYRALKLRIGDRIDRDIARAGAVREAVGTDVTLMADANSLYAPGDAARAADALADLGFAWLEEPFMPLERRRMADLAARARLPLAAGENLFARQEFAALIADGATDVIQPDLSKVGGVTEATRIAALALAAGLPVHPHASMTGLNAAASLHFLCAIENGGFLEADASRINPLRDELVRGAPVLSREGTMTPGEAPGLGVEVDMDFVRAHPPIPGSAYRT